MPESFRAELRIQMRRASEQLREAKRTGDDFLAEALFARLAQLSRLAVDHGIRA